MKAWLIEPDNSWKMAGRSETANVAIESLFGNIKKIITKMSSEKFNSNANGNELKEMLKRTILNDSWLSNIDLKPGKFENAAVINNLDYCHTLSSSSPLQSIEKSWNKLDSDLGKYCHELESYSKFIISTHEKLCSKCEHLEGDEFEAALVAAIKQIKDKKQPKMQKFDTFANGTITPKNHSNSYSDGQSKVSSVAHLSKDDIKKAGGLILEILDSDFVRDVSFVYMDDDYEIEFWSKATSSTCKHGIEYSDCVYFQEFDHLVLPHDCPDKYDLVKALIALVDSSISK